MKLSVIIVSWNVRNELVQCLKSLYENKPPDEFEIIVVDNASIDGTVDTLKRDFQSVRVIVNKENEGFAAANNQAIRVAKGEYILLLNPDTIVHSQSLDNLIRILDENPVVGACGPSFLKHDGAYLTSILGAPPTFRSTLYGTTIFRSLGIFRRHYKKLKARDFDHSQQTEVDALSGAGVMVRKSVFEEIGLLDSRFFMYHEDVDLFLRIKKAGWKMLYVPSATITHLGNRSAIQVSTKKRLLRYNSTLIYFRKHKGKFATALFALIFKPGVILKHFLNVCSGVIGFTVSILMFDRRRRSKALTKVKNSVAFLTRYSWYFLFKS